MKDLILPSALLLVAGVAHGNEHHAHGQIDPSPHGASTQMLAGSTPTDGAVLAQAPRTLALMFAHPVVLQTVAITGPSGPVRASFRRPSAATASYSVALPPLGEGTYEARWTATGQGHNMEGVVRFTVQ